MNFRDSFKLVGSIDMIRYSNVVNLWLLERQLGILFRAYKYFSPINLAILYTSQIRLGVFFTCRGAAGSVTLALRDFVQNTAILVIDNLNQPLGIHKLCFWKIQLFRNQYYQPPCWYLIYSYYVIQLLIISYDQKYC